MSSFTPRERPRKPGDFIKDALAFYEPKIQIPDPSEDYGMYQEMDEAFSGLHEHLDDWWRRNQGRLGYAVQNIMSDYSKHHILLSERGGKDDEMDMSYNDRAMEMIVEGLSEAMTNGELAETGNRFSRTTWQEKHEANLHAQIWPVITGRKEAVGKLLSWKKFKGNVQAYLYGYLDLISEKGKSLDKELSKRGLTVEAEFTLFEKYLAIAGSIALRLSEERHIPDYIISNGWGRWMSFSNKLRTAYGCIAHVRNDYNLRLFHQRMEARRMQEIERMIQTALKG